MSIVNSNAEGLSKIRGHVKALSEAEGLPNHAFAVEGRFKE